MKFKLLVVLFVLAADGVVDLVYGPAVAGLVMSLVVGAWMFARNGASLDFDEPEVQNPTNDLRLRQLMERNH